MIMAKCMACGKMALLTTTIGNVILCKNCASMIGAPVWRDREFASRDELINQKNFAIQKATVEKMPPDVIMEITRFFDEYINAGYVTTINGKAGQTLKVFANYCVIITNSESTKSELESRFRQFEPDDDDSSNNDDSFFSSEDKRRMVNGLMSGRLVQTGIGAVVSATINQQEKEKAAEERARKKAHERSLKVGRLISVGERRIFLKNIEDVQTFCRSNNTHGYLKFIPKGVSPSNIYECEYFFFSNSIFHQTKQMKQNVESIKNYLIERIDGLEREMREALIKQKQWKEEQLAAKQAEQIKQIIEQTTQQNVQSTAQQNKPDAFEEIRKFKQLLDEGIISEDEFNAKKKELLGL